MQEQSWGRLREQLTDKAAWVGRELGTVNPHYTSPDCSRCGSRYDPGSAEVYACPTCGVTLDRDVNAAMNILRAGNFARAARQKDMLCD